MGRKTVYNQITSPEKIANINPENMNLLNDFLEYLESIGRSESTIKNYKADLLIFSAGAWRTSTTSILLILPNVRFPDSRTTP